MQLLTGIGMWIVVNHQLLLCLFIPAVLVCLVIASTPDE
jgi:hypothetical protein